VITTKLRHWLPLKRTELIEAGHPLPDRNGLEGAHRIRSLLKDSGPEDLVLVVLSGGGSALLPLPVEGVSLEEKQEMTSYCSTAGLTLMR